MTEFHVLVAHTLTTYASTLAGVLNHLRPQYRVQLVAKADLEGEFARSPDAMVVSDAIPEAVRQGTAGWIAYYPEQQDVAIVGVDGTERTVEHPRLDDVLTALDHAAARRPTAGARGQCESRCSGSNERNAHARPGIIEIGACDDPTLSSSAR